MLSSRTNSKKIHELFHKGTKVQNKIINDNNFTYRNIIEEINKNLEKHNKILDIGCGAGTLCLYLANKRYKVEGIDISQAAIDKCIRSSELLGLKKFTKFSVKNFPQDNISEKFDFIIFTEVLEHIKDENLALKKLYLLLNKGGKILVTTPSKNAPLYRIGLADEFDKRVGHLRRYTIEELETMCIKAGFEIVSTRKKEGILRNFLFINPIAGQFIRVINKFNLSNLINILDSISLKMFGESDLFIVLTKK